jgi:hypothetical protein
MCYYCSTFCHRKPSNKSESARIDTVVTNVTGVPCIPESKSGRGPLLSDSSYFLTLNFGKERQLRDVILWKVNILRDFKLRKQTKVRGVKLWKQTLYFSASYTWAEITLLCIPQLVPKQRKCKTEIKLLFLCLVLKRRSVAKQTSIKLSLSL